MSVVKEKDFPKEKDFSKEKDFPMGRDLSMKKDLPVGVFDSGVGGISVLREMVKLLPDEDFVFFGDSANAPYGTKSQEQVRQLTLAAVRRLCGWQGRGIKAVVIACNTATSAAINLLRETFTQMPVIGIEPALKPAVQVKEHPNVVVLATPSTVKGEKFHHLVSDFGANASVIPIGCPGLMEFVENGIFEGEEVENLLRKLLEPVKGLPVDAAVLGCTHYPFLKKPIRNVLGEGTLILDGSEGTARQLWRRLSQEGLLREDEGRQGEVVFEMSLPGKEALCRRLLELPDDNYR